MKKFSLTPQDNKTNDKTKQGASPLNDALFLHFKKWNPEILDIPPVMYNEELVDN